MNKDLYLLLLKEVTEPLEKRIKYLEDTISAMHIDNSINEKYGYEIIPNTNICTDNSRVRKLDSILNDRVDKGIILKEEKLYFITKILKKYIQLYQKKVKHYYFI